MSKRIIERKREDGTIIYRIDRKARSGVYRINSDSWRRKWLREIELRGVESLPSGLYTDGRGITAAGSRLLEQLSNKYGNRLRLCIAGNRNSGIRKNQKTVKVTLNHDDLRALNSGYRGLRQERTPQRGARQVRALAVAAPSQGMTIAGIPTKAECSATPYTGSSHPPPRQESPEVHILQRAPCAAAQQHPCA